MRIDIYDEVGIGAGASGVSGGLLHPYSPKGLPEVGDDASLNFYFFSETLCFLISIKRDFFNLSSLGWSI